MDNKLIASTNQQNSSSSSSSDGGSDVESVISGLLHVTGSEKLEYFILLDGDNVGTWIDALEQANRYACIVFYGQGIPPLRFPSTRIRFIQTSHTYKDAADFSLAFFAGFLCSKLLTVDGVSFAVVSQDHFGSIVSSELRRFKRKAVWINKYTSFLEWLIPLYPSAVASTINYQSACQEDPLLQLYHSKWLGSHNDFLSKFSIKAQDFSLWRMGLLSQDSPEAIKIKSAVLSLRSSPVDSSITVSTPKGGNTTAEMDELVQNLNKLTLSPVHQQKNTQQQHYSPEEADQLRQVYRDQWKSTQAEFCRMMKIDTSLFSKWLRGLKKSTYCCNAVTLWKAATSPKKIT